MLLALAPLLSQTVLLDEGFDTGVVPPSGWAEDNLGATIGWEPDAVGGRAVHDDFAGFSDAYLRSPDLDIAAQAVSEVWLHFDQDQYWSYYRDLNAVELSLDGGLSYTPVYIEGGGDGASHVDLDLAAWLAFDGVSVAFHYSGDFANEWGLDRVVVDDQAPPSAAPFPHLPSTFTPALGYFESFDSIAGSVPSHMAVNALDHLSRLDDAEAWCNIGQSGTCLLPYSGSFNLEMGLRPGSLAYHNVSNALILGLDGSGGGTRWLAFQVMDGGEEDGPGWDGVYLSPDGVNWQALGGNWSSLHGGAEILVWNEVLLDLSSSGLNLNRPFFLALAQTDNYPYLDNDGIGIDDLSLTKLGLQVDPLIAGADTTVRVYGAEADAAITLAFSLVGPGPTSTPYGDAQVGSPYRKVNLLADANGEVQALLHVPAWMSGSPVWVQVLEVQRNKGFFSNAVMEIIQ